MYSKRLYAFLVIGIALCLTAAGFGYYFYKDRQSRALGGAASQTSPAVSSPSSSVSISGVGNGAVVKELPTPPLDTRVVFPDLERPIVIPDSFPDEAKKLMMENITAVISALKKDPSVYGDWLNLALYRKQIDDYRGAVLIWEFLAKQNPKDAVSLLNLANIYGYYLPDPKRAETYYLDAIAQDPTQVTFYRSASDFYRDVMKDDAKAKAILQKGIDANPKTSQDLLYMLNHYGQ